MWKSCMGPRECPQGNVKANQLFKDVWEIVGFPTVTEGKGGPGSGGRPSQEAKCLTEWGAAGRKKGGKPGAKHGIGPKKLKKSERRQRTGGGQKRYACSKEVRASRKKQKG